MIARTLQQFFAPILVAMENRASAMVLLKELGWTVDETFEIAALGPIMPLKTELERLGTMLVQLDNDEIDEGYVIEQAIIVGETVFETIGELRDMVDGGGGFALIGPLNEASFWRELALDLPEYLVLTYLRTYMPVLCAIVDFGGCITLAPRDDGRPPRQQLDWSALGDLLSNPADHLTGVYNWGGPLEHALLIEKLRRLFHALGIFTRRAQIPEAIVNDRFGGSGPAGVMALGAPILEKAQRIAAAKALEDAGGGIPATVQTRAKLDALLVPVPETGNGDPTGLLMTIAALGEVAVSIDLGGGWQLLPSASLDASGALGVEIQPSGVDLALGLPSGSLDLSLVANRTNDPFVLLGSDDGTRINLGRLDAGFELDLDTGPPSVRAHLDLEEMKLVISPGEGDGFISDILGETEFEIPLEFGIDWSTGEGLTLTGGAGASFTIPINRRLGPLEVFDIDVSAFAGTDGASFGAGVAGSLTLGPFVGTVDGIGFEVILSPKPRGETGNGGALDVSLGFKPPIGIGLAVEAPGVSGGGYLDIDRELGRYFGILDIGLFGLQVTAIGLIATKLPDGSDGWSMYLSISIIFPGGIQLGFGFKLAGVGGLIAINRGVDIEALGDGVRTGALDAILFPEDAIANAPQILSAIESVFPAQSGQFAFGPVFRLAWGTPTIVTIDLGVVIQLPDPVTISLLGAINIKIGKDDVTIIDIGIDVVGTLWPAEKRLAIDAAIREGQIAFLSLSGDMATRLDFGATKPTFLVAHGGFHPEFEQPEGFPTLARLSLNIFNEEKLRVGVESYLAVTSNSLQFGVAAFFWAKAVGLNAEGWFEFDTLIYLRPFGLTATLGFSIGVMAGSKELLQVTLRGTLTGPQPWSVYGYAEFRALGVKKKFKVEATIGSSVAAGPVEEVDVAALVREALEAPEAWTGGEIDATIESAVSIKTVEGAALIHPAGQVQASQGVAPFGIQVEKLGAALPAGGPIYISFSQAELGGETAVFTPVEDWFAAANFFELSENERVEAPSFERLQGGAQFGDAAPAFAPARAAPSGYETEIIDPDWEALNKGPAALNLDLKQPRVNGLAGGVLSHFERLGSVKKPSSFGIEPLQFVATQRGTVTTGPASFAATLTEVRRSQSGNTARAVIQPQYELSKVGV